MAEEAARSAAAEVAGVGRWWVRYEDKKIKSIFFMNTKKTKIILHGGFSRVDNEQNRSFFAELVRDIPQDGSVLLCYFAYEGDYSTHVAAHTKYIHTARPDVRISIATRERFEGEVHTADALYLNGGDTEELIDILLGYSFRDMVQGKVVGGSSAGHMRSRLRGQHMTDRMHMLGLVWCHTISSATMKVRNCHLQKVRYTSCKKMIAET